MTRRLLKQNKRRLSYGYHSIVVRSGQLVFLLNFLGRLDCPWWYLWRGKSSVVARDSEEASPGDEMKFANHREPLAMASRGFSDFALRREF